jgi:hypothetical protein
MNNKRWADRQIAAALPVKYYHVVFTVPDILNGVAKANPKAFYDSMFDASSRAILKLAADKKYLGATPGFTSVLHTWGQTMQFHPHVHVLLTAGGLADGLRFVDRSDNHYMFPVKALAKLFKGIFLHSLYGKIGVGAESGHSLQNIPFSCHLEEVVGNPHNVVKYLARYVNRVCISGKRILAHNTEKRTVTFSYKDNKSGGARKQMTLDVLEFMRRFLLHVLPKRFMKIRHYGILNNRGKTERIKQCLRLLGKTAAPPVPPQNHRIVTCPFCGRVSPAPKHISAHILPDYIRLLC